MSKEATKRRLAPADRRAQLLACAMRVAARKGLGRTGHTDIARETGVATPTVFIYFPTRRDLLTAVVKEIDRFYTELGHSCHYSDLAPIDAVRQHLHRFADSVDSNPQYAQIWLEWTAQVRNEDGLWDAFLEFQERIIRMLARSIRKCQRDGTVSPSISAPDAARLITASGYAIAQLKFMGRNPRMIQRYVEQALELSLKVAADIQH